MNATIPAPTREDFEREIRRQIAAAHKKGLAFVDIRAGDVHSSVGGYPGRDGNRMPSCCAAMRRLMQPRDTIESAPPKGKGASVVIRYRFPR
jgi:5-methylcytosine-specific restriction protein A